MKTFIYSLVDEMKAALHGNKNLQYAIMLAASGLILTIGVVVLMVLFARVRHQEAVSQPPDSVVEATKTPFQPRWTGQTSPTCYGPDSHAVAEGIADKFSLPYEQVMTWFCSGHEFEDILLALQTRKKADLPVEQLLGMRVEGYTWDGIWQQIEIIE